MKLTEGSKNLIRGFLVSMLLIAFVPVFGAYAQNHNKPAPAPKATPLQRQSGSRGQRPGRRRIRQPVRNVQPEARGPRRRSTAGYRRRDGQHGRQLGGRPTTGRGARTTTRPTSNCWRAEPTTAAGGRT